MLSSQERGGQEPAARRRREQSSVRTGRTLPLGPQLPTGTYAVNTSEQPLR